jgi:hypothetical protein
MKIAYCMNEKKVTINWHSVLDITDTHDSGCADGIVEGEDEDCNTFYADATLQDGEIVDVDIDTITDEYDNSVEVGTY